MITYSALESGKSTFDPKCPNRRWVGNRRYKNCDASVRSCNCSFLNRGEVHVYLINAQRTTLNAVLKR